MSKRVIIVSDGTGETAASTIKAAMVQFEDQSVTYTRYKNVRDETQIEAIIEDAAVNRDLVVYTLVSPQLRKFLDKLTRNKSVPSVDLLGPLLVGLSEYFGFAPKATAGLLRDVNELYFSRIDAMEYTIAHDDGRNYDRLEKADLIILGISRTSKTPLSMYLSHHGWRVANIPLIYGFQLPKDILQVNQKKIIGLTIDPEELVRIRQARLERLGQDKGGDYADMEKVNEEVEYANELFRKNRRWAIFNVTGKAVEETASEIIKLMSSRGLIPPATMGHSPQFSISESK